MKGLLSWICIGCVGAIAIVALVLGCYNTYQTQSGNGSINVRSATVNGQVTTSTLGGSVVSTVVQTGTYDIFVSYVNPAAPFTQLQDQETVGTYSLSTVQIQGDTATRLVLELSPMTYTFTKLANAANAQFQFRNFSNGGLPINNYGLTPLLNPYNVVSSASGTTNTYRSVNTGTTTFDPTTFFMLFYPKTEPTLPNGSTVSTSTSIKYSMGTIEN